jgi:hypothetical protein
LAIASAAWVLATGCREDEPPSSEGTEGDPSSSSGPALDASGSDDAPPGACIPGEARACYEGPPGTEGLGACAAGQQVCAADGSAWSECAGQVWPEPAERCDTPGDDDCDGLSVCEPSLEWSRTLPAFVTHVAGTPGGGAVVVGTDAYDVFDGVELEGLFVTKLDAAGSRVWSYSTGFRAYAWPGALAVDAAGATVVTGWYDGAPDLGGGPLPGTFGYGAFAVRYTADGAYEWGHALESEGYFAVAFGPDGTTYLAGGYVFESKEPGFDSAQLHVVAVEPDGSVAWMLPGYGPWYPDPVSLFLTAAGELALVATAGGSDLELGALEIPAYDYQPLLVRIGLDGTPLGHQPILDPAPLYTYELRAFARPGGALAVATVVQEEDGSEVIGTLVALDEALAPASQRFLGTDTWVRSSAPYPDGTTLVTVDFSGLLELGPIGVGGNGPAVAAIDDEGHGRWAELLHTQQSGDLAWAAAASDGAVLVGGYVDPPGGVLAGGTVEGGFVAKLRP